jgi:hypothetical protein
MVRFVAWLVAFGWMACLLKKHFETRTVESGPRGASRAQNGSVPRTAVRLERDPWCGTYVSPEISFPVEQMEQQEQETRVIHFCSAECRARYLQLDGRAAG